MEKYSKLEICENKWSSCLWLAKVAWARPLLQVPECTDFESCKSVCVRANSSESYPIFEFSVSEALFSYFNSKTLEFRQNK